MKLDKKLLEKVSQITGWNYELNLLQEEIEDIIEDLLFRYEELDDRVKELEEDIEYNYVPINELELIGMREDDF